MVDFALWWSSIGEGLVATGIPGLVLLKMPLRLLVLVEDCGVLQETVNHLMFVKNCKNTIFD